MKQIYSKSPKIICSLVFIILLFFGCDNKQPVKDIMLTDDEIRLLIEKNSPLNGAKIPIDIKFRLGSSHVAGKYYLTTEPYLIEGCKAIANLGMGTVKLWFQGTTETDYAYNSKWDLPEDYTLVDQAKHPYFKAVFDMPFRTFVLSVRPEVNLGQAMKQPLTDYSEEEFAIYKLAQYLYETYRDREVIFIFQNWEGDWLMRGGTGPEAQWTLDSYPSDVEKRSQVMTDWFKARQAGLNRARDEAGRTKCKIYHAIEVNKVLDCMNGVPGLTLNVLPNVETDMVSWSCYDGLSDPVHLWKGIDYILEKMKPTGEFPGIPVMIGEIGIPENEGTVFGIPEQNGEIVPDELVKRWDRAISVFMTKEIPYIIQWEVYCNEPKVWRDTPAYTTDQLRGFWLIRPDGTESYAASYLKRLLQNPGGKIVK